MATATKRGAAPGKGDRGSFIRVAVLVLALTLAAWVWQVLKSRAELATAYDARLACSCRHVAGRSLAQCVSDPERSALVRLSEDAASRSITARVPLLGAQTARWRGPAGCRLDPYDDQAAASVVSIQPPPTTRSPA
jgi:hypothetical protein